MDIKMFVERLVKPQPKRNYSDQEIIFHLEVLPQLKKSAIIDKEIKKNKKRGYFI